MPLPGFPTYVVAILPSKGSESALEVVDIHSSVLGIAQDCGMSILSIGSDGAATEVSAQSKLVDLAAKHLPFDFEEVNVHFKIPLFGPHEKPLIVVQDPTHARKVGANQILSGARLLSMGSFYLSLSHIAQIVQGDHSPLYQKDAFNTDKQDDGRAYRTFNNDTFAMALELDGCTGLAIYLFIIGEACDAWLNQTMSHQERIISAFTSYFFIEQWERYLYTREKDSPGLMSYERNGISHQSFKTLKHLAISLLMLIISHQIYYPEHPFMPWKHGTEACEHIFGWMRVIMENFTVLDARQMMPKIFTIVKNIMAKNVSMPKSEHIHSGEFLSSLSTVDPFSR